MSSENIQQDVKRRIPGGQPHTQRIWARPPESALLSFLDETVSLSNDHHCVLTTLDSFMEDKRWLGTTAFDVYLTVNWQVGDTKDVRKIDVLVEDWKRALTDHNVSASVTTTSTRRLHFSEVDVSSMNQHTEKAGYEDLKSHILLVHPHTKATSPIQKLSHEEDWNAATLLALELNRINEHLIHLRSGMDVQCSGLVAVQDAEMKETQRGLAAARKAPIPILTLRNHHNDELDRLGDQQVQLRSYFEHMKRQLSEIHQNPSCIADLTEINSCPHCGSILNIYSIQGRHIPSFAKCSTFDDILDYVGSSPLGSSSAFESGPEQPDSAFLTTRTNTVTSTSKPLESRSTSRYFASRADADVESTHGRFQRSRNSYNRNGFAYAETSANSASKSDLRSESTGTANGTSSARATTLQEDKAMFERVLAEQAKRRKEEAAKRGEKQEAVDARRQVELEAESEERQLFLKLLSVQKPWIDPSSYKNRRLAELKSSFRVDPETESTVSWLELLSDSDRQDAESEMRFIRESVWPKRDALRESKSDLELNFDARYFSKYGDFLVKRFEARSHFERLGIARNSSPAEVKSGFRKMALIWHPDNIRKTYRHCFAHESSYEAMITDIYQLIDTAYRILADPIARRNYEMTLSRLPVYKTGRSSV